MAESCSINAHVRNKDGNIVVSQLWLSLMRHTHENRPLTQRYYALGTNTAFLKSVEGKAEFDENGQITFASLKKLAKLKISEDDILKDVREDFKRSSLTYQEAVNSVNEFNKSSQFKNKYLATLIEHKDGTFSVDIVERTKANEAVLKDMLKQIALRDYLVKQLESLHCNVEFLSGVSYRGQYDTTNVEKAYNNLYTLIRIAKRLPIAEQNRVLSKEIGHFVVGVLGDNNSLIKRLSTLLTPEVVNAYTTKYADDSIFAPNQQREIMGHLIGDALYDKLNNDEKSTVIGRLLSRIKARVVSIFKNYRDENKLLLALTKVEGVVSKAANGFISGNSNYDLEKVLNEGDIVKETLYDSRQSDLYNQMQQVAFHRQQMIDRLKKTDFKTAKALQTKLETLISNFQAHKTNSIEDLRFLRDAILVAYDDLQVDLLDAEHDLAVLDGYSNFTIKQNMLQHSQKLYEIGLRVNNAVKCSEILNDMLGNPEFARLRKSETIPDTIIADDPDLFFGEESYVSLEDFDNTDAVFDAIDTHDGLFRDTDGNIKRTAGSYEDNQGRRYVRYHRLQETTDRGGKIASTQEYEGSSTEEGLRSMELGLRTDAFLRVIFKTKGTGFEEAIAAANAEEVESLSKNGLAPIKFDLNDESDRLYLETLQNNAISLMQNWARKGIKWKTENLVVSTQLNQMRVAGEMDLLLKYPDGHVEIWDFKTTKTPDSRTYSAKKNVNYETQLNFYAKALRDNGLDARIGGVIQINPDSIDSGKLFYFRIKTRRNFENLLVCPFELGTNVPFLDALDAQYRTEVDNNTGTVVTTPDVSETPMDDRFKDATKRQILTYIKTYYPQYLKAASNWFSNASVGDIRPVAPYNRADQVLYYLGIVPKTNREISRFNAVSQQEDVFTDTIRNKVGNKTSRLKSDFTQSCNRFGCVWLTDIYGANTIKTASKGLHYGRTEVEEERWGDDENAKKKRKSRTFYTTEDTYTSAEDIMASLERDLSFVEFLFRPMGRTFDIPAQMVSKMIDVANARADREAFQIWRQLNDIKKKYKLSRNELLGLYERDEENNLTGNYISKVNRGRYEKDLKAFRKKAREEDFPAYVEQELGVPIDEVEKDVRVNLWNTWYKKKWRQWHNGTKRTIIGPDGNPMVVSNGHSIKVDGRLVPNPNYRDENGDAIYDNSETYDRLSDEQKACLEEVLEIKKSLDELLGHEGLTYLERAPQIHGNALDYLTNKTGNSIFKDNIIVKGYKHLLDLVHINPDDTEFGNDLNDLDKEEWFGNAYRDPKNHVSEVPLFYIKDLKEPNKLSTDIFASMAAYASMALGYKNLNAISYSLELVNTSMNKRKITNPEAPLSTKLMGAIDRFSRVDYLSHDVEQTTFFARGMRSFLEMNLYSRKEPVVTTNKAHTVWNKLKVLSTELMTFRFLGGNMHGATVNAVTGINEIWKEAVVGEDLDWKAAAKAHALFIGSMAPSVLGIFKQVPGDLSYGLQDGKLKDFLNIGGKEAAWFRYFNARGDNAFQDKHRATIRVSPVTFMEFIMSPYSLGDYYMQGMSYLITAMSTKVYKRDGSSTTLYGAYQNDRGILSVEPETYFTSAEFAQDYDALKAIYNTLLTKQTLYKGEYNPSFTAEESDLLRRYIGDTVESNSNDIMVALRDLIDRNMIGEAYEMNEYMRKCRAINDRMHGIYNKANKTTLHSSLTGSMLLSLRGYLLGYVERDFASEREDATLGRHTEGVYKTFFKYLFHSQDGVWNNGITRLLYATVGASLSTIPILSNVTGMGKAYNKFMSNNSDLGDYQINNLKRLGAKMNLITLVQFVLAPLCLEWGLGDPDDPDDDKQGWLIMYYILKRANFEQMAASLVLGMAYSAQTGMSTGWMQDINRNSSIVPVQTLSAVYWIQDLYQLAGMLFASDPESDFYKATHYTRSYDMDWEVEKVEWKKNKKGELVRKVTYKKDVNGNKIPVYKTGYGRALHGNHLEGDPKFWRRLISITPFVKSYPIANDPVKAEKNYIFGQTKSY